MPIQNDGFALSQVSGLALKRGQFKSAPGKVAPAVGNLTAQLSNAFADLFAAVRDKPINILGAFDKVTGEGFAMVVRRTPVRRAKTLKRKTKRRKSVQKAVPGGRARDGWRLETVARSPTERHVRWVNSVPYIVYLEFGWSKQAPAGMVRVTLFEKMAELNRMTARILENRRAVEL